MKKTPFLIVIPAIAAAAVVGIAVVFKLVNPIVPQSPQVPSEFPNAIRNSSVEKPTSRLSTVTANDLSNELNNTVDDGGKADLDAIAKDAQGL